MSTTLDTHALALAHPMPAAEAVSRLASIVF